MFEFVKKCFFTGLVFSSTLPSVNSLSKGRPQIVNVNSDDPVFYPFSIKASECSGSCNSINNHMQKCVFLMLLKT